MAKNPKNSTNSDIFLKMICYDRYSLFLENNMTTQALVKPDNKKTSYTPSELQAICHQILEPDNFKDYCPNGLQVDANTPISHIVTGVSACQALIDKAVALNAQAVLVHHGYFWKGEDMPITGMKGTRIRTLLQNNISLFAYHLPLDAHPTLGNNALLAQALDLTIIGALYPNEKHPVGNVAKSTPILSSDFCQLIEHKLARTPLHITSKPNRTLTKIALCTGAAQDMIEQAYAMGADAFISGEISERTTHQARELGVDYFACGHHATERFGIKALGEHLATHFGVQVTFVDINNIV